MDALCHKQARANWAFQTVSFSFLGVDFLNNLIGRTLLPASQYLRPEVGNLGAISGVQRCMGMNWQATALGMAGVIGCCVAVVHGILTQRLMVRPFEEYFRADKRIGASIRRLVPLLLHFSTISWFLGGLALIAAANWFEQDARFATGLFVGSLYL
ncbi:MAG: hypothetical protein WBE29_17040, partial [Pseudolabrys sp.]